MQILTGQVISNKLSQTVTVSVKRRFMHPIYKKSINITKKYLVHDTKGVSVGDTVKFTPCKPISKRKKWIILDVISSKQISEIEESTPVKKVKSSKSNK